MGLPCVYGFTFNQDGTSCSRHDTAVTAFVMLVQGVHKQKYKLNVRPPLIFAVLISNVAKPELSTICVSHSEYCPYETLSTAAFVFNNNPPRN